MASITARITRMELILSLLSDAAVASRNQACCYKLLSPVDLHYRPPHWASGFPQDNCDQTDKSGD
jgi:hypothetical protein